jgi:hypothetical protein
MTMDPSKNQTLYEKKTPGLGRYGLAANCAPGHGCVLFRSVDGKRDGGKLIGSSLSWRAPHIECSSSDAVVEERQRIIVSSSQASGRLACVEEVAPHDRRLRETGPMQPWGSIVMITICVMVVVCNLLTDVGTILFSD